MKYLSNFPSSFPSCVLPEKREVYKSEVNRFVGANTFLKTVSVILVREFAQPLGSGRERLKTTLVSLG